MAKKVFCPKCGRQARRIGELGKNVVFQCKCGFTFREKGYMERESGGKTVNFFIEHGQEDGNGVFDRPLFSLPLGKAEDMKKALIDLLAYEKITST